MIHWGVFGGSVSRCCLTLLTVRFGPSEAKSNIWITEQHVQFQHTNRSALSRFFSPTMCTMCFCVLDTFSYYLAYECIYYFGFRSLKMKVENSSHTQKQCCPTYFFCGMQITTNWHWYKM